MLYIWLGGIIVFAIAEALTLSLTSIWFACGSLAAMIFASFGAPIWLQCVAFLAVSCLTLWLTKPVVQKYILPRREKTNADRIIGCNGHVTEQIDNENGTGQALVSGQVWTARSSDGGIIPVGASVIVERISGVKVLVSRVPQRQANE